MTRKLTADDVRMMRELHAWKMAEVRKLDAARKRLDDIASARALAEKFDVSQPTVEKILQRITWISV